MAEQSFILIMRFQSCKLVHGDLQNFRKSKAGANLICFFPGDPDQTKLREKALAFARKNGLTLIRCADAQAIFRK